MNNLSELLARITGLIHIGKYKLSINKDGFICSFYHDDTEEELRGKFEVFKLSDNSGFVISKYSDDFMYSRDDDRYVIRQNVSEIVEEYRIFLAKNRT